MKKSNGKIYYDLSEIDEVYNDNQPQLILNTDQKDSCEEINVINLNNKVISHKSNIHVSEIKKSSSLNFSENETLKKFNSEKIQINKILKQ